MNLAYNEYFFIYDSFIQSKWVFPEGKLSKKFRLILFVLYKFLCKNQKKMVGKNLDTNILHAKQHRKTL